MVCGICALCWHVPQRRTSDETIAPRPAFFRVGPRGRKPLIVAVISSKGWIVNSETMGQQSMGRGRGNAGDVGDHKAEVRQCRGGDSKGCGLMAGQIAESRTAYNARRAVGRGGERRL